MLEIPTVTEIEESAALAQPETILRLVMLAEAGLTLNELRAYLAQERKPVS